MPIDLDTPQGHCPRCGAPIYTETIPTPGYTDYKSTRPVAVYTCECHHHITPPGSTTSENHDIHRIVQALEHIEKEFAKFRRNFFSIYD